MESGNWLFRISTAASCRISDLEVQDQPIEETIRRIHEEQLLYNHPYDKEDPPP